MKREGGEGNTFILLGQSMNVVDFKSSWDICLIFSINLYEIVVFI